MSRSNYFLVFFLLLKGFFYAQEKDPKFFFRDTMAEVNGITYEFTKIAATGNHLRANVIITNKTTSFLVLEPKDLFCRTSDSSGKFWMLSKDMMVVAPNHAEKFTIRYTGDLRSPSVEMDFMKLKMTGEAETIFTLAPLDVSKESFRQTGPVKFTIKDKDPQKWDKVEYRIVGRLEYFGGKFLGILPPNVHLKTNDGGDFANIGAKKQLFYYNNRETWQPMSLTFPLESERAGSSNAPTLYFENVFGEYSLKYVEGFKVKLTRGTLADYKNRRVPGEDDD